MRGLLDLKRSDFARISFDNLTYSWVDTRVAEKAGKNVMTTIGVVHSSRETHDDRKTLQSARFQIGDLICLSIFIPSKRGQQAEGSAVTVAGIEGSALEALAAHDNEMLKEEDANNEDLIHQQEDFVTEL